MASADTQMDGQGEPAIHTASSSGLEYKLHPLVLINISDHVMRTFVSTAQCQSHPRVIGCLLGQHTGRTVDISNSFELMELIGDDGLHKPSQALLEQKTDQYKQTFPSLDIIGWYVTGSELQDKDMHLHKIIAEYTKAAEYTKSPVMLLMDSKKASVASKELPVRVFESVVQLLDGKPHTTFVQASHVMETTDAERIAVNTVAHILPAGAGGADSALAQHLSALSSAMQMMADRVQLLLNYCAEMESGKRPHNHKVVRMMHGLLSKLPTMDSEQSNTELLREFSDGAMVNMLSLMTKGVDKWNDLAERSHIAYDSKSKA